MVLAPAHIRRGPYAGGQLDLRCARRLPDPQLHVCRRSRRARLHRHHQPQHRPHDGRLRRHRDLRAFPDSPVEHVWRHSVLPRAHRHVLRQRAVFRSAGALGNRCDIRTAHQRGWVGRDKEHRRVRSGADRVARPVVRHGRATLRPAEHLQPQLQPRILSEGQRELGTQRRALLEAPVREPGSRACGVRRVGTSATLQRGRTHVCR